MPSEKVEITEEGVLVVITPEAQVLITRLPTVGTQVAVYDDPDATPIHVTHVRSTP